MIDARVELYLGGVWVDITPYRYVRDPITFTRGYGDEADDADPGQCAMTLDNRDGRFSPRLPTGAYHGLLGRNTPLRLFVRGVPRFYGEVAAWPQHWSTEGADRYVKIQAAGIMRRLSQGTSPIASALSRATADIPNRLEAYWPMEDGADSVRLAAGIPGVPPMQIHGKPKLAESDEFACSLPIPVMGDGILVGTIPVHEGSGAYQTRFLCSIPEDHTANQQSILLINTTGTIAWWHLAYMDVGQLRLQTFDSDGNLIGSAGPWPWGLDGKQWRISVELFQNGGFAAWAVSAVEPGGSTEFREFGNIGGWTVGKAYRLVLNNGGGLGDVGLGHLTYQSEITSPFDLRAALDAHRGEPAGVRLQRLGTEYGVSLRVIGTPAETVALGYQAPDTLPDVMRECATADGGLLCDDTETFGMVYRTRADLYNRLPEMVVPYGQTTAPLEPVDDDQQTRNDVTVTRAGGSSYQAVADAGPMSVQAPPNGVGRYDTDIELSLAYDSDTPDQAGWRLHLGTVDEARYPVITLNDANLSPATLDAVEGAEIGDRIEIPDPPPWLPPGPIDAILRGWTSEITDVQRIRTLSCSPASPYDVAVNDTGVRYAPVRSVLATAVPVVGTALSVTTADGPLWTTDPAEMPIELMIGGERMSVSAIVGETNPQTFTVVRALNGVVKPHDVGSVVELATPAVRAL